MSLSVKNYFAFCELIKTMTICPVCSKEISRVKTVNTTNLIRHLSFTFNYCKNITEANSMVLLYRNKESLYISYTT